SMGGRCSAVSDDARVHPIAPLRGRAADGYTTGRAGRASMDATVVSTFFEQARKLTDAVALRYKRDGEWAAITWNGYADLVRRAAGGLRSLGLDAGEPAAILSTNRYEWHVADIAIQSCGGITV